MASFFKSLLLCASVVGALISSSLANVVVLDASNFDALVDGSKPAFVEFYAPWCGHCKALAPEYEIVGEAFKGFQSSVLVGKVDCDANKDLCSKHGVSGYPTLKWFNKGDVTNPESYSSGRSADDIIGFINQKTGLTGKVKKPATQVTELNDSNFKSIVLDSSKDVFVEFFAPWCGHCKRLAPDWEKLGHAFAAEKNVVIAKIDADRYKDNARKYGVSGFPTLVYFAKGDKEGERYSGDRSLEELIKFVNEKAGTSRQVNGRLAPGAARISALHDLAVGFINAADKNAVLEQAKTVAAGLADDVARNAKIYLRAMEKIISEGAAYVKNEIARLNRILEGGSLTADKVDDFSSRIEILESFESA